ncbi:Pre-mRNA cleavage complex II protein Clp1-domain-containing protein [Emericellopsis atlantica]|uniref:Polynucleotide 5'-hydroxyl-kinase GRC3 n=1 Tax=Emericellopsis atlantica TaxID=2614577 RepID=A0A9P8CNI2_9HYPO|nr:Pre-mRNA cleavage complex II protein Clp1-domain-containing protein [Emericellopsis atlantica]KAG9253814.1 Pre-mRNA cleavage complex II protein Clp1-domain-containing protein [Emericellopsis atlantica]
MSIPGLGQIPSQTTTASARTITLRPAWEYRFETESGTTLTIKLNNGVAEKDGIELAPRTPYTFANIKSKITTWHGCELDIEGATASESVAEYATLVDNPGNALLNLHARLSEMRDSAARERKHGPRVLITGPADVGKTTVTRTLASYATKQGSQPLVVNCDPEEGILTLPGTLSAAVFATVMDPEATDGWGSTPTSGPSSVPVKLPIVQYYGQRNAEDEPQFYRELVARLADTVSGRMQEDADVKASGVIIDSIDLVAKGDEGYDILAHIVDEFSVNVIVVLGSAEMNCTLAKRFGTQQTSVGEPIHVVSLDKSEGAGPRSNMLMERNREAVIKEYFFGDARRTLSPQIQQVDFGSLVIYKLQDGGRLVREQPSSVMQHWTLAIMHASTRDTPETIRAAGVMGYVYVSDVDEERRKVKMLAPVSGRLGDRPMVWGRWPEPYINLLG